jgi:hypothetical protein
VRSALRARYYANGSSQEKTIGEYAQDEAGEESILPVVLHKSEVGAKTSRKVKGPI